jgi:hypothetical protein
MRGAGVFQLLGLFLFFFFAAIAVGVKVADTHLVATVLCASDTDVLEGVAGCEPPSAGTSEDPAGDTVLPGGHAEELALATTNTVAPAIPYPSPIDNTSRILLVLHKLDALLNTMVFNQRAVEEDLNRLNDRIDALSDHRAAQSSEDRDDLRAQIADITDDATLTGTLTLADLPGGLLSTDASGNVSTTSLISSLEDLTDVASMTETSGELLYWNGSAWSNIATSSLGLASPIVGTSTEVAYFGGDGSLTSSSEFTFDSSQLTVTGQIVSDTLSIGEGALHALVSPIGTNSFSSNPYRFAGSLFSSFGTLIDLYNDSDELSTFGADMAASIMAITSRGAIVESTDAGDTYSLIGSLLVKPPLITDNAATVENTATVYIDGAPSTSVTGGNYALWVASSTSMSRIDGLIAVGTTTPSATLDLWSIPGSSNDLLAVSSEDYITEAGDARMFTITTDGKVGIGTSTPSGLFSVISRAIDSTGNDGGSIYLQAQGKSAFGAGNGGSVYIGAGSGPSFSPGDTSGSIAFGISTDGGEGLAAEYARIDADGNFGVGTSTPTAKLTVAGDTWFGGDVVATGTIALSGTGTSTFAGPIAITGSIIPTADNTYSLGSASNMWKDVYIGPGSLYVNGKKVIEDISNTVTFSTDSGQSLSIQTSGTGNVNAEATGSGNLNLLSGSGNININSTSGNLNVGTTGSGLLRLGTVSQGVWQGTAVAVAYGGTGATTTAGARTSLGIGTLGTLNSVDVSSNTNLSVSATGLTLSGDAIALAAGYTIPLAASTTEWAAKVSSPWSTNGSDIYYSTGKVGINNSSPALKLDIKGTDAAVASSGSSENGALRLGANGTNLVLDAGVYSGSGTYSWIQSRNRSDYTSEFTLALNPQGGNVGIGTTTPDFSDFSASSRGLDISPSTGHGTIRLSEGGTSYHSYLSQVGINLYLENEAPGNVIIVASGGSCTMTGAASGGTCFSDARLKTVTGSVSDTLSGLATLDLVNYHWNEKGAAELHASSTMKLTGFLAQQVEAVFPELVHEDKSGYKTLDYGTLSMYGIVAIKDLNLKLEDLATTTFYRNLQDDSLTKRLFDTLIAWFSDTANGIGTMVAQVFNATEMICVDNECLNAADIRELKSLTGSETGSPEPEHVRTEDTTTTTDDHAEDATTTDDGTETATSTDEGTQSERDADSVDAVVAEEENVEEETKDTVTETVDEPAVEDPAPEESTPEPPAETPSEPASV